MELRHLRYFLAVADSLNFSRAAERLRVAQPALSRQISALEEQLGFKLFERTTTQVQFTEAGRYFRREAEKLLMQLDIAVTGAQRIAKGTKGDFKIGTGVGTLGLLIADAARELHRVHPEVSIDFVEMPAYEHPRAIREQKIDIGFVSRFMITSPKDIDLSLLYTCPFKVVMSDSHPLAGESAVSLRDLKDEQWLTLDETELPGFKVLMAQIMRPSQFTPKFGRAAQSIQGILAFVGTGEGVALLPELVLNAKPEGIRYVDNDCAPHEIFAIWSKTHAAECVPTYVELLRRKLGDWDSGSAPASSDAPVNGAAAAAPAGRRRGGRAAQRRRV